MHNNKLSEAIELLGNSKSKKRESGAKRLRKLADIEAGSALLAALKKEMKDKRTWACQYHMILALGFCSYEESLPYLLELGGEEFNATILYRGIGDAIFRLSLLDNTIESSIEKVCSFDNFKLMAGAFTALAMLQMIPNDQYIKKIIKLARDPRAAQEVRGHPRDNVGFRKWVATASAGWKDELKRDFLNECLEFDDQHLKLAANSALLGKYEKWLPY